MNGRDDLAPAQITTFSTRYGPCRLLLMGAEGGPPLVLLHGYGSSADSWRRLATRLGDKHAIYAPDLLGFGDAPKPRGHYTPHRWARQIVEMMEALALPRAVVVGHSLGGLVALTLAREAPDRCAGLVLIDALGIPTPEMARAMSGAPGLLVKVLRAPGMGELIFWSLRGFRPLARSLALDAYHDRARAPHDALSAWLDLIHRPYAHRAYLSVARQIEQYIIQPMPDHLTLPALIIWGANDIGLPVTLARGFQALLPRADLVVIPECGHIPHVEHPDETAAALRPFLDVLTRAEERQGEPALLHTDANASGDPFDNRAIG